MPAKIIPFKKPNETIKCSFCNSRIEKGTVYLASSLTDKYICPSCLVKCADRLEGTN